VTRSTSRKLVTSAVAMADFAREPIDHKRDAPSSIARVVRTFDIDLMMDARSGPGVDGPAPPASGDGVSLFAAIQEQLGLKLDARSARR
jgi:uncharacterized protein (TIGR03435 family)